MASGVAPVVSVVLPVYNGATYLREAVESILGQTLRDLELIVVDDGSTDDTPAILGQLHDTRLRTVRQPNKGVAAARNSGIELARGRYIAQMDADDVSRPERLAREAAFLDDRPSCGMVGTWAEVWRGGRRTARVLTHPADNARIQYELLLENQFVQSSVMVRRAVLDRIGPYSTDPARQLPEDYELWSRIARQYELANIPEHLQLYRETEGSLSRQGPSPFLDHLVTLAGENIALAAGVDPLAPDAENIAAIHHWVPRRIVGVPDFDVMRSIFQAATVRVTGSRSPEFRAEADRRIDVLEQRWRDLSGAAGLPRRLRRAAGRVRRRLVQLAAGDR